MRGESRGMRSLGVVASFSGSRWEEARRGHLTVTIDRERLSLGLEPDQAAGCASMSRLGARSPGHVEGQDTSGDPRRALRRRSSSMGGT